MRTTSAGVVALLLVPSSAPTCPLIETASDDVLAVAARGIELPELKAFEVPAPSEPELPKRVQLEAPRPRWSRPACLGTLGPSPERSFTIRAEIPPWQETALDRGWIREPSR